MAMKRSTWEMAKDAATRGPEPEAYTPIVAELPPELPLEIAPKPSFLEPKPMKIKIDRKKLEAMDIKATLIGHDVHGGVGRREIDAVEIECNLNLNGSTPLLNPKALDQITDQFRMSNPEVGLMHDAISDAIQTAVIRSVLFSK